jgi:hypothetical protein
MNLETANGSAIEHHQAIRVEVEAGVVFRIGKGPNR